MEKEGNYSRLLGPPGAFRRRQRDRRGGGGLLLLLWGQLVL